ncbi:arylsulfatase B [Botrimarina mediterranea]|uniref:Arylsulfatase n=1 Tax=Botrimarina mediterranea TaxID=2528022 RepID=A0A518KDG3_9BACT|nr:arylsulfatase [Botrimarina mediterranea]QDV75828.1 Arylsulfatase [Botrimarina mediterranea]QDV80425.1 Arylsulfatase [Planctomycetes bacterium K2D]
MMSRSAKVAAVFALLLQSALALGAAAEEAPNIVVIVADDLGWNDVGYHGSPIRTPRLDALAREGVELDRFYVCPICTPTRAGLMTGRYPHRFGMRNTVMAPWRDYGIPADEACLPELLAAAGYERRACVGKWHLGHARRAHHPLSRGFTSFYGHYNGAIDYFTHLREGELDWHRGFESSRDEGYTTTLLADEAVRFIEASDGAAPFLLYLPFNAPHAPLQAEPDALEAYGFEEGQKRLPHRGEYGRRGRGATKRATFSAMVTALDTAIGRVLDSLEERGLADNTLVWVFSDNGGEVQLGGNNKPLRGAKHTVWEGGVRVPAIVRWPAKFEGGRRSTELAAYVDVLPTLLAAAKTDDSTSHQPFDGVDLLPMLTGQAAAPDRTIYLGQNAIVSQEWKLKDGKLFDLTDDPNETTNIADEHPKVAAELCEALKRYEALASKERMPGYAEGREGFVAPKDWAIER